MMRRRLKRGLWRRNRLAPVAIRLLVIAAVIFAVPSADRRALADPIALGVMGDSISAPDGVGVPAGGIPGGSPNWVTQLTNSGQVVVPAGGNQAVGGATTANLPGQLAGIQSVAGSLTDSVLFMGGNDFQNLLFGNETASQFTSSATSNIDTTLAALRSTSIHQIVATIPNTLATPAVQAFVQSAGIPAATIAADESALAQANATIEAFALANGIPVIDFYGLSNAVLETGSITMGGVTLTPSSGLFADDGFHPSVASQGLLANMVIEAADGAYGDGLTPFSDQQILTTAGITPGVTGPTFINLAPFVLLPSPEPSSAVLAGIAVATSGLFCVRRRRRSNGEAK